MNKAVDRHNENTYYLDIYFHILPELNPLFYTRHKLLSQYLFLEEQTEDCLEVLFFALYSASLNHDKPIFQWHSNYLYIPVNNWFFKVVYNKCAKNAETFIFCFWYEFLNVIIYKKLNSIFPSISLQTYHFRSF